MYICVCKTINASNAQQAAEIGIRTKTDDMPSTHCKVIVFGKTTYMFVCF